MKALVLFAALAIAAVAGFAVAAPTASAAGTGTVNIVHGIPGVAVDVCARGPATDGEWARVITDFEFGDIETRDLDAGSYDANVVAPGAACETPILPGLGASGVALPEGANASVIAHLPASGVVADALLTVGVNDISDPGNDNAILTVYHAAAAPAVDIRYGKYVAYNKAFSGVENTQSGDVQLSEGRWKVSVLAAGDRWWRPVTRATLNLEERTNTVVYAIGSLADGTFMLKTQVIETAKPVKPEPSGTGALNIVHGIPGVAVDVCASGPATDGDWARIISGFNFGDIRTFDLDAGPYDANVVAPGAACETPILPGLGASGVVLPEGANASVIAHLPASGEVADALLTVGVNDNSDTGDDRSRLTVYHVAAAPAVDIRYGRFFATKKAFSGVENTQSGDVELREGRWNVSVLGEGERWWRPVTTAKLNLDEQTNTIVYAIGSLEDGTFTLKTQTIPAH